MKVSTARKINAVIWFVAAVALMLYVKVEWSKYGDYTALSLFSSLVFQGGLCLLIGYVVDEQIVEHFNRK